MRRNDLISVLCASHNALAGLIGHAEIVTTAMQPLEAVKVDLGKAQVIDRVPKVIKELKFGVL